MIVVFKTERSPLTGQADGNLCGPWPYDIGG